MGKMEKSPENLFGFSSKGKKMIIIQEMTKEDLEAIIDSSIANAIVQIKNCSTTSEKLITRKEAAEYLHISLGTLHTHTKSGKIRGQRIGCRLLYRKSDLDKSTIVTNKQIYG